MLLNPVSLPVEISVAQRAALVAAVIVIHVLLLGAWSKQPTVSAARHEMSINMVMAQASTPLDAPLPEPVKSVAKPKPQEKALAPVAKSTPTLNEASPPSVAPAAVLAAAAPVAPSAPTLPDREPDFAAGYLNNPKPAYPLAARRMGWQGKVIVRVEVLASGAAGAVSVYQSSGRDVLDNAALAAVKSWRFTPARVAGQLITKTFLVPIPFKLESDSE